MESWIRTAIVALVFFSFLRRVLKAKAQRGTPSPATRSNLPSATIPRTPRPRYGRKNDFRDVPPPPENPDLG
ncbi:MAG: hypothetical protein WBQ72_03260 [Terriglobales bacterium]|jgi:hypothetical protein